MEVAVRDPSGADVPGDRLRRLADVLGHVFARPELLEEALTHASATKKRGRGYERLEFLGDRVLGLILADTLLAMFPTEREGDIAKRHARLVSKPVVVDVARQIDLGASVRLSKGEDEAGSRDNDAVLADAMEAVIAAVYLDGGLEAARRFVDKYWRTRIDADTRPPKDAKTRLQEWAQARALGLPAYAELSASGPPHAPSRTIEVRLPGHKPAIGGGRSKREAEQAAAAALLKEIGADG